MRDQKRLGEAATGIWSLIGHDISRKACNFAANARSLAREDGDSLLGDNLFCMGLAGGTESLYSAYLNGKIGCR